MTNSFSSILADFSNLYSKEKEGNFYLQEVIQRTFIKVTETGTEAAAVTGAILATSAAPIEKKIYDMNVNHSFIFLIKDKRMKDAENNDLMLFIGSCNDLSNQYSKLNYFNVEFSKGKWFYKNQLKLLLLFIFFSLF